MENQSSAILKDRVRSTPQQSGEHRILQVLLLMSCLAFSSFSAPSNNAIQFDVFFGYDRYICAGAWFPITFEVKNDGESFSGAIEVSDGNPAGRQMRRMKMEFPKGALKRVVMPCYAASWGYNSWDARLLDSDDNVVAEHTGLRPQLSLAAGTPLLGSIPRTPSGDPQIRQPASQDERERPTVARLLPALVPDNALYLEGLTCIYLNSAKAAELTPAQGSAITRWTERGGHLVVAIEELQDVQSSAWLKELIPWRLEGIRTADHKGALQEWITGEWPAQPDQTAQRETQTHASQQARTQRQNRYTISMPATQASQQAQTLRPFAGLASDPGFESQPMRVATVNGADSGVVIKAGETPLVLNRMVGFGEVTVVLFSPEREPVRSWANSPVFWAKLAHTPPHLYTSSTPSRYWNWGADAVFGAILDSRQVHTLPAGWLFLLLIGYILVIGPVDYFWLRRLGRPMLTWITFPAYVIAFSCLIYFIGFKLRAGQLEWNELHIVDALHHNNGMKTLRGRTYASLYSPSTRGYSFQGPSFPATFRPETAGGLRSGGGAQAVTVEQRGDSFSATGVVPVWTSQVFASDWDTDVPPPCLVTVSTNSAGFKLDVRNRSGKKLGMTCVRSAMQYDLGTLSAGETLQFDSQSRPGKAIAAAERPVFTAMEGAARMRNMAFGRREGRFLDDWPAAVQALSIPTQTVFALPPGLSLLNAANRDGTIILFVWADDTSPVPALPSFNTFGTHKRTIWRILINTHR